METRPQCGIRRHKNRQWTEPGKGRTAQGRVRKQGRRSGGGTHQILARQVRQLRVSLQGSRHKTWVRGSRRQGINRRVVLDAREKNVWRNHLIRGHEQIGAALAQNLRGETRGGGQVQMMFRVRRRTSHGSCSTAPRQTDVPSHGSRTHPVW